MIVIWAGCSEMVLQFYVICKLSYSNFVCEGYFTTVQMVSAENGRLIKKMDQLIIILILIKYLNCQYSVAHSLVRSISQSPRCLHTQRTVKKKAQAKLRRLSPLCSWPCMFSKRLNAYAKTTKYSCACSLSVSIKCHQPL